MRKSDRAKVCTNLEFGKKNSKIQTNSKEILKKPEIRTEPKFVQIQNSEFFF